MKKFCNFCHLEKNEEEFSLKDSSKGRRSTKCKTCHNLYVRNSWYVNNRTKQIDSSNKWRISNKDKTLKIRYPFSSIEECNEHLLKTNCEICGATKGLVFDHCHLKLKYRGALCGSCNKGLGLFKDNLEYLQNAIKYLNK